MKVFVVGSGGREHAVVDALARHAEVRKIYAAPGNGGIGLQAELVPIAVHDIDGLLAFARERGVDLTFVGPELPLSLGIVDIFRKNGLRIIGPSAADARLESSKIFAKRFFKAQGIPTANFWECANAAEAYRVLENAAYPIVVKADGLASGKGVTVAETAAEARAAVHASMEAGIFGDAGARVVIEEFLVGEEASFQVFADGRSFLPMAPAQDHKRRFDGDRGPNTGGMGAYSADGILSRTQYDAAIAAIIRPTLEGVESYSGILYAGLILTAAGPKIIEYNARFGDPETQVVLPRLQTNLLDVFFDIAEHRLSSRTLEWRSGAAATVALVCGGYPGKFETGNPIRGLEEAGKLESVRIYHAGTRAENGRFYTAGGRVLNVTAYGPTLQDALDRVYAAVEIIEFEGKDYRKDIGKKGLERAAHSFRP